MEKLLNQNVEILEENVKQLQQDFVKINFPIMVANFKDVAKF